MKLDCKTNLNGMSWRTEERSSWFRCGKLCYSWWDNTSCLELLWDYSEEVFITWVDENQAFG